MALLVVASVVAPLTAGASTAVPTTLTRTAAPALAQVGLSAAAGTLAQRVLATSDAAGRPFAVVDKHAATIAVYRADGSLAGISRALLGRAPGDHSVPGVGQRTQTGTLRAEDRTTPAGRFRSEPGRNRSGEAVVWVDYNAAFAIHRLRSGPERATRERSLASADVGDKRLSAGCVVVPEAFYDAVVQPVLGTRSGVVYVMPEGGGELLAPDTTVAGGF